MALARFSARSRHLLLLAALGAGGTVAAADAVPLPDDFLEYLGSWETDDADWLVARGTVAAPAASSAGNPATPRPQPMTTRRAAVEPPSTTTTEPQP